jgi:hypothetical protein
MPGGGSKPGERRGGRQKGARNRRIQVRLADAARIEAAARAEGITPVELMVKSMRMLWDLAHRAPEPDLQLAKEACAIAASCAPYLHPRLTSIAATVDVVHTMPDEMLFLRMSSALERLDRLAISADEGDAAIDIEVIPLIEGQTLAAGAAETEGSDVAAK